MKWVFLVFVLATFLISGCGIVNTHPDASNSSFIDYSKPRFSWFHRATAPTNNATNSTTIGLIEGDEQIDINRDYYVGTWNIQIFGRTKAEDERVFYTIVSIVNDYDIIAIQEIRDTTGTVQEKLTTALPGMRMQISERLGRTTAKEQYAFLYSGRVVPGRTAQFPDPQDKFEREPFMMEFTMDNFTFIIINVHIKPEDAEEEIKALEDVINWTKIEFQTTDIIIMGDLNADCKYFDSFDVTLNEYYWITNFDTTITPTTDCSYDRIITLKEYDAILSTQEDKFEKEVKGDEDLLYALSDHYAIYFIYDRIEVVVVDEEIQ